MATFKRIGPPFADGLIERMLDAVEKPLTNAGTKSVEIREDFMRTWRGPRPTPEFTVYRDGDKAGVKVIVRGTGLGFMKWVWLKGTMVRYAQMTDDFQPKTQPDVLVSRPGKGGLAYVDTSRPHPGIEDRRVKENAATVVSPILDSEAREALLGVLKNV